jgi:hypothetical protein
MTTTLNQTDAANLELYGAVPTPAFLEDYARWVFAKHRMNGGTGPLGDMLIVLCHLHGMLPEVRKPTGGPIEFSKVPLGRRLFVTYEGPNGKNVTEGAEFRGMAAGNMVVVLKDSRKDSGWVDEFRPHQISLDDPRGVAEAQVQPAKQTVQRPPAGEQQSHRFQQFDPTEHLRDQEPQGFTYRNKAIQALAAGATLKVLRDGVAHPAQLVKHGPGDFQIAVLVDGEEDMDVVDEENVLLPPPPKSAVPKKKLSGAQKRKRAAEKAAAAIA